MKKNAREVEDMSFSSDDWTEESKISFQGIPLPEDPKDDPLNIGPSDEDKQEGQISGNSEQAIAGSEQESNSQARIHEDSVNSILNLSPAKKAKKRRQGVKTQSNVQKILKYATNAHFTKNFPAEMFRKIKKFLIQIGREDLLEGEQKRFNVTELNFFIQTSGLTEEDWEWILDLKIIFQNNEKSKKLGTCKYFKKISVDCEQFLIHLSKEAQKILYRSAKRVIKQLLKGEEFVSYMDRQAQVQLRLLDQQMKSSPQYSAEYESLLARLN